MRLGALADEFPGSEPTSPVLGFTLMFAAAPLVGAGLLGLGAGRAWFRGEATTPPAGPHG